MKSRLFVAVALVVMHGNSFATEFHLISSSNLGAAQVKLFRALKDGDTRKNPDGSIFYRTIYKVELIEGAIKSAQIVESDLYTAKDLNFNGMRPGLLVDPESRVVTIFSNGKDPGYNYSMVGYAYRLDSERKWKKEVVFPSGNHGWFSYFGGSSAGNPELWHFSYAGYRQLRSVRNADGTWNTTDYGGIQPEKAAIDQKGKKKIVVASTNGVQSPAGHFSHRGSASGNISEADVLAGAVVFGALKWLFGGGANASTSGGGVVPASAPTWAIVNKKSYFEVKCSNKSFTYSVSACGNMGLFDNRGYYREGMGGCHYKSVEQAARELCTR